MEEGFDVIVSSIPAQQARRFAALDEGADTALSGVEMRSVWTLLLAFGRPVTLDPDASRGVFSEIVRNRDRPGRPEMPDALAAHAGRAWSEAHLDLPREDARDRLIEAFAGHVAGAAPEPLYAAAHRWRYARVDVPLGRAYLSALGGRLLFGGDWALGPDAQHAWDSGRAMAAAIAD